VAKAFARPALLPDNTEKSLPAWQEGMLDIHHIALGRGEATFVKAPDGTTLLIDVGDMTDERPEDSVLPILPDASKTCGEWAVDYIRQFDSTLTKLDYVLLTHFHSDHIGMRQKAVRENNGYALSGITMLAEHLGIGKLVDRDYPNYDFPSRESIVETSDRFLPDYMKFVEYQKFHRNTVVERFLPGSAEQFAPLKAPDKYPFMIRNIAANCVMWTGKGSDLKTVFTRADKPGENTCSCVIKMTYGKFVYFSGGDLTGSAGRDMESPVADVTGRVDAMSMNHHAYKDAANEHFMSVVRPRVMVIPVWDTWHPHVETLTRMTDTALYPDRRYIFATGQHHANAERLGAALDRSIHRPTGHTVIRVSKGGDRYRIFILDPNTRTRNILFTSEEIKSSDKQ